MAGHSEELRRLYDAAGTVERQLAEMPLGSLQVVGLEGQDGYGHARWTPAVAWPPWVGTGGVRL